MRRVARALQGGLCYVESLLRRWRLDVGTFLVLSIVMSLAFAGCGNSNDSSSHTTTGAATDATGSSLIAIDCKRQRGYVPLPDLDSDLHGPGCRARPQRSTPTRRIPSSRSSISTRSRSRVPSRSISKTGTVMVLVDSVIDTGTMLLINESDDSMTTVPFPFGSRPNENSAALIDSSTGTALVTMSNVEGLCPTGFGGCTGQATFDLTSHTFGPLLLTLIDIDSFGWNPSTTLSLASSDPLSPELFSLDQPAQKACGLNDSNQQGLDADPDGIAVDPTTDIWVAGNFTSSLASVIDLTGATSDDGPYPGIASSPKVERRPIR